MQIERLQEKDFPALLALWESTPGMGLRPDDDSPEGLARFLRRNPESCFAAYHGSELVGSVLGGHDGRRTFLYHVCVKPEMRGQHMGRRLVQAALEALKQCGIHKVCLVCFQHNETGNRFWENDGWVKREDLHYYQKSLLD